MLGGLLRNGTAVSPSVKPDRIVVVTDRFSERSETFIATEIDALRALGHEVRVEAIARPSMPNNQVTRALDVDYVEDEGVIDKVRALTWLVLRHPIRAVQDRKLRSSFRDEWLPLQALAPMVRRLSQGGERHIHVHFAALASVCGIRAARIGGQTLSIAAHGHELFKTPRALEAKFEAASFVAAPSEYTAQFIRRISPRARVEVVVMGVDGKAMARNSAYPGGRRVLAIGRLVAKKGFADLIRAAAHLERVQPLDRVVIVGDGPLRESLTNLTRELGIEHRIELIGAADHAGVRVALQQADLLVMPCVIAADGDRDAMPVVVKEALATEVPVVGTDEVGLPEVIRPDWGRLAPPGRPELLAAEIASLLELDAAERATMGQKGRAFVLERFGHEQQAENLARLIASVRD